MIRNSSRLFMFALAVAAAGCASHPAAQPAVASAQPPVAQAGADEAFVAELRKTGYKVVEKDGEELYCRRESVTGSNITTRTTCLTERQVREEAQRKDHDMSRLGGINRDPKCLGNGGVGSC